MRRIESARKSGCLGGVPGAGATFNTHRDSKLAGTSLSSAAGIAMPLVKRLDATVELSVGNSAFLNSEYLCWQGECGAVCEGWCSVQQVEPCDA
ncbi:MAG TPA: hypothetical protein VGE93_21995 [Bryobacteraceae bacterium]